MHYNQKKSNGKCELYYPLYLIWICGVLITALAIVLIIADFNIEYMLLMSSSVQTFLVVAQIIVTFRLKLFNEDYNADSENEFSHYITIISQIICVVVNTIATTVRNHAVAWYVFLMIFMPFIIGIITASIYGVYLCCKRSNIVSSDVSNNMPSLKPELNHKLNDSLSESSSETADEIV